MLNQFVAWAIQLEIDGRTTLLRSPLTETVVIFRTRERARRYYKPKEGPKHKLVKVKVTIEVES